VLHITNFIEIPQLQKGAERNYFIFVVRIHKKKGIENLLTALSTNREFLQSRFTLKIAGRGTPDYEAGLRNLVSALKLENKVEFVGQVEGVDKEKLYANAFWTIMPSHTENFGLVVLESLAQNTPVIASKGSPWSVLEKEHLGLWVNNSPDSLSSAITSVMKMSEDEYEAHRRGGRSFVELNYDIDRNIDKWIEVYRSLN
jgi:glycosyltransferase involved in cell wall biosynthesis